MPTTVEENRAREAAHPEAAPKQLDDLHTEHGDTTIADQVMVRVLSVRPG